MSLPTPKYFGAGGWVEAVGTAENGIQYLTFRDGPYWLKAGCDGPESVLGGCENYNMPEQ